MIELIFTPRWFSGGDIFIDTVCLLVLALIALFSFKYYKLESKKKNYFYLALSFSLLALAYFFKILINFSILTEIIQTRNLGFVTFTIETIKSSDNLFFVGFFLYRLLLLIGLYMLFLIYQKHSKPTILLILYLILISIYFSQSYFHIFHLTTLVFLVLITAQHFKRCKLYKTSTTKMITISFALLSFSNLIFLLVKINSLFYVIGEIIQLSGYILLLVTFITVLKNGQKKN